MRTPSDYLHQFAEGMCRLSWVTILLACLGCGEKRTLDVTGTVLAEGGVPIAAESSMVVFQPDDSSPNPGPRSATAAVEADGSFTLMTKRPGDGVMPGDYRVVLWIWSNYGKQVPAVPVDYTRHATTPLRARIDFDSTRFDFVVNEDE